MQPTASSAPAAPRPTGSAPAECDEVPDQRHAGLAAAGGDRPQVGELPRAVVDVRPHDQAGAVPGRRPSSASTSTALAHRPRCHRARSGRSETRRPGPASRRRPRRRAGELEQVDGDGVAARATSPGQAPISGAIASPARRGSVDPVRPRRHEPRAPLGHDGREPVARGERQPAERVAVEVEQLVVVDHEAVAEARPAGSAASSAAACARLRRSATAPASPRPRATAGRPGRDGPCGRRRRRARSSTVVPGRERRRANALGDGERNGVVGVAVDEQQRHAERDELGRRRRGVALGHVVRRAAEQAPHDAVADSRSSCAAPQVGHAGLADRGDAHAGVRAASHSARCPPALWPIATTRPRSSGASRPSRCRGTARARRRRSRASRRPSRRRAAGTRGSRPPSRAARDRSHTGDISSRAVVRPSRSRRAGRRRPGTVRRRPGGAAHRTATGRSRRHGASQAVTPSERTASARRETPSPIWSGVTPE